MAILGQRRNPSLLVLSFLLLSLAPMPVRGAEIPVAESTPSPARLGVTPKSGVSWLSYQEGTATDFSAMGVTLGLSGWHQIGVGRRIQLSGSFTALPVDSNGWSIPVRFAAVDAIWLADLGPAEQPPFQWRARLGAGAYYKRMFVSDNVFGYSDLNGPVFIATLGRSLSAVSAANVELKFAPMLDGLVPMSPSNRDLKLALEWRRLLGAGRFLGVSAEWSEMRVQISTARIASSALTLGVTYGN